MYIFCSFKSPDMQLRAPYPLSVRNILQKSFVSHICFAKDFPLFFIRRIAFAKLGSFAHHVNILVDLGPPKPHYLIAAGLRPTNRLARWRTATGKGTLISNGTYETKNRPLWPLTVPLSSGSLNVLGEFDFSDEKLQDTTGVLPPKKQAKIISENWGPPNR